MYVFVAYWFIPYYDVLMRNVGFSAEDARRDFFVCSECVHVLIALPTCVTYDVRMVVVYICAYK